jgi:hypothetical protein
MEISFLGPDTFLLHLLRGDVILPVLCDSGKFWEDPQSPADFHVLQGKGKSTKEVLKRIDYGGSLTLLLTVRSFCSCSVRYLTFYN